MKGEAELNAFLLQAKHYERLKAINVGSVQETDEDTTGEIVVNHVPSPMVDYFTKKIRELVTFEKGRAVELLEQAAQAYAKAL
ncbi:MAG: hypothetical protein IJP68_02110 [Selenomonadaceae bacterium]|nr:hypothetical protein [Selenomonadaceae bacterium]